MSWPKVQGHVLDRNFPLQNPFSKNEKSLENIKDFFGKDIFLTEFQGHVLDGHDLDRNLGFPQQNPRQNKI